MEERWKFVLDYESGQWSMVELCERYGITRPTGYKWLRRYRAGDVELLEQSRAPHGCPHRTPARVEELLLEARREYGWGAKKLIGVLTKRHPTMAWPARSTVNDILERHGMLRKHRRRKKWSHPGAAPLETTRPNQVWPADFKGQFRIGDGGYCYPLTVTDHFSRALLGCHALKSVRTEGVKPRIPPALPRDRIARGDPHRQRAAVRFDRDPRAVRAQRVVDAARDRPSEDPPSNPQENGTHERMHRELKRETVRPPAHTMRGQQRKFDLFRKRYNEERPHEGIGDRTPASLWQPSPRPFPERIAPPEYPAHMDVRRVSTGGCFRLHSAQPFLSNALQEQHVGLEEVGDGIWNIVYYETLLGRIDERSHVITGV